MDSTFEQAISLYRNASPWNGETPVIRTIFDNQGHAAYLDYDDPDIAAKTEDKAKDLNIDADPERVFILRQALEAYDENDFEETLHLLHHLGLGAQYTMTVDITMTAEKNAS